MTLIYICAALCLVLAVAALVLWWLDRHVWAGSLSFAAEWPAAILAGISLRSGMFEVGLPATMFLLCCVLLTFYIGIQYFFGAHRVRIVRVVDESSIQPL